MGKLHPPSWMRSAALGIFGALLSGCGGDDEARTLGALHIIAGNGSLAYFQLMWPHVDVVQANNPNHAVIEPLSAGHLFAADGSGNRQWLATSFAPWIDSGGAPMRGMEISAFVSGLNQTHTSQPTANLLLASDSSNIAGIALYQAESDSFALPLVSVGGGFVGTAPGAPAASNVLNADGMITLYQASASVDLSPTTAEETRFQVGADAQLAEFGRRLIIAAKALRDGHSGSVVVAMPGLDPHGAFADIPALEARLRVIQAQLNGFHELLGKRAGDVLITISGDTPKTPLERNGWPDGTPSSANWTYVVGKGYLKRGWFGAVRADGTVATYDPATGLDDTVATPASRSTATAAAIAYAGTRGDHAFVRDRLSGGELATYQGVVR